jgi:hypothetical protein
MGESLRDLIRTCCMKEGGKGTYVCVHEFVDCR